nr:hypothetical protein [Streptomyces thermoviolaceus]
MRRKPESTTEPFALDEVPAHTVDAREAGEGAAPDAVDVGQAAGRAGPQGRTADRAHPGGARRVRRTARG